MDSLLIGVPLGLLPFDAGGVVAEGREPRLLVEETGGTVDGVLARRDGRDERALRLRHHLELLRVLSLGDRAVSELRG